MTGKMGSNNILIYLCWGFWQRTLNIKKMEIWKLKFREANSWLVIKYFYSTLQVPVEVLPEV